MVFDLIEQRDWEGVNALVQSVPDVASVICRFTHGIACVSPSGPRGNLALHEVIKHQAPIRIVNLILETNMDAVKSQGQFGYLPLHVACSSGASLEVVSRLIELYPAATRLRDELDEALPIHLAAKWGASDDVLMEILTTHPEGSFMRDASGKTPMDHAKDLPYEEIRSTTVCTLEAAPVLVAAAKAATRRVTHEQENRMRGLKEAHTEFVRQLEEYHESEKTTFLEMELQFQNELAEEKERNIYLTEVVLEMQGNQKKVKAGHNTKSRNLEKERDGYCLRLKSLEREIGSILSGVDDEGERKDGVTNGSLTLQEQLKEFTRRHGEAQKKVEVVWGDLKFKEDAIRHLHELLSAKDGQMRDLNAKISEKETIQQQTAVQAKQVSALCDRTQQELDATREEVERLRRLTENQHVQLIEVNRKMHVQECRMGNIKNLVSSLSYNVQTWAVDDEWDQKQSTFVGGIEAINGKGYGKKKHAEKRTEAFFLTESDSFHKRIVDSEMSFETADTATATTRGTMDLPDEDDDLSSVPDEDDDLSSALSASPAWSHAYATASSSARSHMSC